MASRLSGPWTLLSNEQYYGFWYGNPAQPHEMNAYSGRRNAHQVASWFYHAKGLIADSGNGRIWKGTAPNGAGRFVNLR